MGIIMKNKVCYSNGGSSIIQPVIYSDTEREIGVWRDGKPLYQKTISTTTSYVVSKNTWTRITDLDNIAAIIDALVFTEVANYSSQDDAWTIRIIEFSYNKGVSPYISALSMRDGDDYIDTSGRITLRYTKTTDTPGSGTWTPSGVPSVHYDGTEKIIGTWFGETLYEITNQYSVNISSGSSTVLDTIAGIKIVKFQGLMDETGGTFEFPERSIRLSHRSNGDIEMGSAGSSWNGTLYLTIQYIKLNTP